MHIQLKLPNLPKKRVICHAAAVRANIIAKRKYMPEGSKWRESLNKPSSIILLSYQL
jgi:hypothetical protein